MKQTYLCKFDADGHRTETHIACEYTAEQKEAMIADGYIEITEEDWNYYVGNMGAGDNNTGYIRDPQTGKPVSAPVYVPSKEERLAQLDAQYEQDKKDLMNYYTEATVKGNASLLAELQEEMQEVDSAYIAERKAIEEE